MKTAERLFLITQKISRNKGITAPELAKACGTSVRNIYRDIKRLDEIGVQVLSKGREGYYLVENVTQIPSQLNAEEYLAMALFPYLSDGRAPHSHLFRQAYKTALEKILPSLKYPKEFLDTSTFMSERIRIQTTPVTKEMNFSMQRVMESILRQVTIRCIYHSMYRDAESDRMIDPYYIVPRGGHLYLIGYCHTREKVLTFRLSRFREVELTSKRCFIEEDFDIDRYLSDLWGIGSKEDEKPTTFQVWFSPAVARYIKEESYYQDPEITDNPDGSILFAVTVRGVDEFLRWFRQYGTHAELLKPEKYRRQIANEIEEMRNRYRANV
ncbi:transcriptional regulator [Effusibacillus lacus]|uniref:Transcriptional regulator n=1 Tax=Effusibacillus lacus TaxID=1348429 RepID=A0A292YPJ9_9BACL|nr:transcriptional regulator [Effusibacillus lacus]